MLKLAIADNVGSGLTNYSYTISIRLSSDGYCFAIIDPASSRLVCLFVAPEASDQAFSRMCSQAGLEDACFSSAFLVDDCQQWSLLPSALSGIDANAAWQLCFGPSGGPVSSFSVDTAGAVCLFSPTSGPHLSLLQSLGIGNVRVVPVVATDLADAVRQSFACSGPLVYLRVSPSLLNAYVVSNGRLQLANMFQISGPEDALYFVLGIFREMELDRELSTVILQGALAPRLASLLVPYVRLTRVASLSGHLSYPKELLKVDSAFLFNDLLNVSLCV